MATGVHVHVRPEPFEVGATPQGFSELNVLQVDFFFFLRDRAGEWHLEWMIGMIGRPRSPISEHLDANVTRSYALSLCFVLSSRRHPAPAQARARRMTCTAECMLEWVSASQHLVVKWDWKAESSRLTSSGRKTWGAVTMTCRHGRWQR